MHGIHNIQRHHFNVTKPNAAEVTYHIISALRADTTTVLKEKILAVRPHKSEMFPSQNTENVSETGCVKHLVKMPSDSRHHSEESVIYYSKAVCITWSPSSL